MGIHRMCYRKLWPLPNYSCRAQHTLHQYDLKNSTPNLSLVKNFTHKITPDVNRKSKTPPREMTIFFQHLILLCIRLSVPLPLGNSQLSKGIPPLQQGPELHLHHQQHSENTTEEAAGKQINGTGSRIGKGRKTREKRISCYSCALPLNILRSQVNCFK